MVDLSDVRKEYGMKELRASDLETDPFQQFHKWYNLAQQHEVTEANAMVLATVDSQCRPSQRLLLLKHYDQQGFVFYTNYGSRKAKDLALNQAASLLFWWKTEEQQIRIEGNVSKISNQESNTYFNSRDKLSRIAAMASNQSQVLNSKQQLIDEYERLVEQYQQQEKIPCPDYWGGYRLVPTVFEFWQGGKNRLHDRFRYSLDNQNWRIERLAP